MLGKACVCQELCKLQCRMLSEPGLIFQSCSCGMVSEEPHYRPFTFVEDCTNNSTMGKCLSIKECDNVDNVCTLWNIGTGKNKTKDVCAVRSTNTGKSKITDWSTFIFHILVLNKLRGHLYLMMSCLTSGTVWAFFFFPLSARGPVPVITSVYLIQMVWEFVLSSRGYIAAICEAYPNMEVEIYMAISAAVIRSFIHFL